MKHRKIPQSYPEAIEQINELSQFLRKLSDALKISPRDIILTNAPEPYDKFPAAKKSDYVFNWWNIPEREDIGLLLQYLRMEEKKHENPR